MEYVMNKIPLTRIKCSIGITKDNDGLFYGRILWGSTKEIYLDGNLLITKSYTRRESAIRAARKYADRLMLRWW
jgi:hypothetical protein